MRAAKRDPTTTINMIIKTSTRPKPRPALSSVEKHKQLEKQFSDLQQQWLQQNKQPPQPPPSSSSSTSSTTTSEYPFQTLFHNSPRSLMSSLQKGKLMVSPDGWQRRRIAANISTEDILTERKAAIESGIIKGRRRLFDDEEEICSSNNVDQEIQIHHHHHHEEEEDIGCSCRCRWCCRVSSYHDHEKEQVFAYSEDENKVWEVKAEKGLEVNNNGGCKKMRKMMVPLLGWFSVSILVLVMGILLYKVIQIVVAAYDEIGHQNVVTLAPT